MKYEDQFDRAVESGELTGEETTTQMQNFKKLLLGRIRITPVVRESGYSTVENLFAPKRAEAFTSHPKSLARHELHLILSKKSKNGRHFLESFNRGLKRLEESGKRDRIHPSGDEPS